MFVLLFLNFPILIGQPGPGTGGIDCDVEVPYGQDCPLGCKPSYSTIEGTVCCDCPDEEGCESCDIECEYNELSWEVPDISTNVTVPNIGRFTSVVYASDYFTENATVQNTRLEIHDQIIIDINITFENCEFVFYSDGAKIDIFQDFDVQFSNSHFYSIGSSLWEGISIRKGNLTFTQNYIEDAYYAIKVLPISNFENPVRLFIEDNMFVNNNVGIYYYSFSGSFLNFEQFISGNHFNNTDVLKTFGEIPNRAVPYDSRRSFAAIYSHKIDLELFEFDCDFSSISNHANGIVMVNADLEMSGYYFNSIRQEGLNYNLQGNGVVMNHPGSPHDVQHGNRLSFLGWNTSFDNISAPNFDNVYRGIYNSGDWSITEGIAQNLNVETTRMDNVSIGIEAKKFISVNITDNEILHVDNVGISLLDGYCNSCLIEDNHINPINQGIGVDLIDIGTQDVVSVSSTRVQWNEISGTDYSVGIRSLDSRSVVIATNRIIFDKSEPNIKSVGIHVNGNSNSDITTNGIFNNNGIMENCIGVLNTQNTLTSFRCLDIQGFEIGMQHEGVSTNDLFSNDVNTADIGWFYVNQAQTGVQRYRGNIWENISGPWDAWHDTPSGLPSVGMSVITIGANHIGTPYDPAPVEPVDLRATFGISPDFTECPQFAPPGGNNGPFGLTPTDSLLAIGEYEGSNGDLADRINWQMQLNLYTKIKDLNLSYWSGGVFATFINDCESAQSNIADFYDMIKDIEEAETMPQSTQAQVSQLDSSITQIYNDIHGEYLAYYQGSQSLDDLYADVSSLKQSMSNYKDSLETVLTAFVQQKEQDLLSAQAALNSISTSHLLDNNLKDAYSTYIKNAVNGLTQSDISQMLAYNNSCFYNLMEAASIYKSLLIQNGYSFDENFECNGAQTLQGGKSTYGTQVYPNPVENVLHLDFVEEFSGKVFIVNINGNLMMERKLNESYGFTVDISALPPGVYMVTSDNIHFTNQKFIKL